MAPPGGLEEPLDPSSKPPVAHPEPHLSDTTSASSEVAAALGPFETSDQTDQTDTCPDLPLFPVSGTWSSRSSPIAPKQTRLVLRTGRSQSLAQISGPIKRKPLSSTASPLATRYSTPVTYPDDPNDSQGPEHRFARAVSLDSPTLYEFPAHRKPLIATSTLQAVEWASSPDSSQPYVFPP